MKPRLKDALWERDGDRLLLVYDIRERFTISDPDGAVETLLRLLREGGRTVDQLAAELAALGRIVSTEDVAAAVELLDSHRLLEDEDRLSGFDEAGRERFFSNLAFFESFATLERGREEFQRALRDSHVLVLGVGGLGTNVIPHLCGLGIGRLTLLDQDAVESRNFARQFLSRHADIGARKVQVAADWVREYDPSVKVEAIDAAVRGAGDVTELLDRCAPDVVVAAIDTPDEVDDWVNAGCVTRRVPFVRAGMRVTQGLVWSVEPGQSACRACLQAVSGRLTGDGVEEEFAAATLYRSRTTRTNRGIGPVAGLLGALSAFEVLRYLTRFEPPAYAGRPLIIDFAGGCAITQEPDVARDPDCPVCGGVR
jgi:molybdopterin/thiamine biosynthesis adenylyltransferase